MSVFSAHAVALSGWLLIGGAAIDVARSPLIPRFDEPAGRTAAADSSGEIPTAFSRMPVDQVRTQLLQWLAASKVDKEVVRSITAQWADLPALKLQSGEDILDLVIRSMAEADPEVRQMATVAGTSPGSSRLNLEGARSQPFAKAQIELFTARLLTQHRFYDEALTLLDPLDPQLVVDPASLFFYRAICRLKLLKTAEAADDLTLLLNSTLDVPARFRSVAELMQKDTAEEPQGMQQVTRLMSDVQRRLDLQHSDDPVQKREEEVIAALDRILKEMEQQQQQQQSEGQGGGNPNQPGQQGAEQSALRNGSPVEGDAERKELTESGNWGMLDKQSETRARELIRQQFPPNFLDAVSRYTRKLAEQKE